MRPSCSSGAGLPPVPRERRTAHGSRAAWLRFRYAQRVSGHWLNTYHPLAGTPEGPWRHRQPSLPPFADASCRREPDLESDYPTITGLCRPPSVRKLEIGDVVIYTTVRDAYEGIAAHRRMTAVLRVIAAHRSHPSAADFYRTRDLPLPRNLFVPNNPPLPLDMTEGFYWTKVNGRKVRVAPDGPADAPRILAEWDAIYRERRDRCQDVRICEIVFRDLWNGRIVDEQMISAIFGPDGFPNTEYRPARIGQTTAAALLSQCGLGDIAPSI